MKVIVDADYIHNLPEAVGKSNVDKDVSSEGERESEWERKGM